MIQRYDFECSSLKRQNKRARKKPKNKLDKNSKDC